MKKYLTLGLIIVCYGPAALASYWSCSASCSVSLPRLIATKSIENADQTQRRDFSAYCANLGGVVQSGPGGCKDVNNDNYQCVQRTTLSSSGHGFSQDVYESRQEARRNCPWALQYQMGSNCAPYITVNAIPSVNEPVCTE